MLCLPRVRARMEWDHHKSPAFMRWDAHCALRHVHCLTRSLILFILGYRKIMCAQKKGNVDCSNTSCLVTLDVMSSVFKSFCKAMLCQGVWGRGGIVLEYIEIWTYWIFFWMLSCILWCSDVCNYKQTKTPPTEPNTLFLGKLSTMSMEIHFCWLP